MIVGGGVIGTMHALGACRRVRVVPGPAGRGMAHSPAIAEETWEVVTT